MSWLGDRPERVRDEHAVVVVLDLAVVFRRDPLDHGPPGGDVGGRDERRQPSVGEPAHPPQLGRRDRRRARRRGAPVAAGPSVRRSRTAGRGGPRPRRTSTLGSQRAPRRTSGPARRRATPNAWCSAASATPSPKAGSNRPPDITASVASSLASTTGLRPGRTSTLIPNLSLLVRPAPYAIATIGSGASLPMRSDSQRLSKPHAVRRGRRARRSGTVQRGAGAETEADADLHRSIMRSRAHERLNSSRRVDVPADSKGDDHHHHDEYRSGRSTSACSTTATTAATTLTTAPRRSVGCRWAQAGWWCR